MAKYPFSDLHSFKDYVAFVKMCAPDLFPSREGVQQSEQWSLELAFAGLREGLDLAEREKGHRATFSTCEELFRTAYQEYLVGNRKAGFLNMAQAQKLLNSVSSQ